MSTANFDKIDRQSPVPLYFQLAGLLTEDITRGRWLPGDRLVSEAELCEAYGVSRATVRQALLRLENEGMIERVKGRGTFVADSRDRSWLLQSSEGFFNDEVSRLRAVNSTVLRCEVAPLPHWASEALGLPDGGKGVILERLRAVDGQVVSYVSDYLLERYAAAARSLEERDGSLYDRIAEMEGVSVHGGRRVLEATFAKPDIAKLLNVGPRTPLLLIESVSWDVNLQPFQCFHAWLRTDRVRVEIEVSRSQGQTPSEPSSR
jgi:GntR family transcriptional regulator